MIPANDPDGPDEDDPLRVYFVRLKEEMQVVGLFLARDASELARIVDECCDAADCEYLVTDEPGGVYVSGLTSAQWPPRDNGEDIHPDDNDALRGSVLSDNWWVEMIEGTWHPLT